MPGSINSLLEEGSRVWRELAVQQGLAYSTYGQTLERYGKNEIEWLELFKVSGDICFKEAAHIFWSLLRSEVNLYALMLSVAGTKTDHPEARSEKAAATIGKPAQRGRR